MPAPRCPLCRSRSNEIRPVGAVRLCARCAEGNSLIAADDRGWEAREETSGSRRRVRVQTGRPTGMHTKLMPEGIHHKAIKLLVSEIQVGERAFDDAIYISTSTRRTTAAWLEGEDVRRTLLEVVRGDRVLTVKKGLLLLETTDAPDLDRCELAAHALAVALLLPSDG